MKKVIVKILKYVKFIIKNFVQIFKAKKIIPIEHPIDTLKLLNNKVALITGGSGGIGYAIAKSYIESGCKVIISGTNKEKLSKLCNKLGGGRTLNT